MSLNNDDFCDIVISTIRNNVHNVHNIDINICSRFLFHLMQLFVLTMATQDEKNENCMIIA